MTDHVRDLVLIAKEINVRDKKVRELTKTLNSDEKFVALRNQLQGHKVARDQNIVEAHRRVVYDQELGPEVTWEAWVEENLDIKFRRTMVILQKVRVACALSQDVHTEQQNSVQSVALWDEDADIDEWLGTTDKNVPAAITPVWERPNVKAYLAGWHGFADEERAYMLPILNTPMQKFG